jgi:hypothetical protein
MSWDDAKIIYQKPNAAFRVVEDDGCYVVLVRCQTGEWKPTPWIFPEAHDVLVKLTRPRGAIYDIERDGPIPEGTDHAEFVAQKVYDRLEEEKKGGPS